VSPSRPQYRLTSPASHRENFGPAFLLCGGLFITLSLVLPSLRFFEPTPPFRVSPPPPPPPPPPDLIRSAPPLHVPFCGRGFQFPPPAFSGNFLLNDGNMLVLEGFPSPLPVFHFTSIDVYVKVRTPPFSRRCLLFLTPLPAEVRNVPLQIGNRSFLISVLCDSLSLPPRQVIFPDPWMSPRISRPFLAFANFPRTILVRLKKFPLLFRSEVLDSPFFLLFITFSSSYEQMNRTPSLIFGCPVLLRSLPSFLPRPPPPSSPID